MKIAKLNIVPYYAITRERVRSLAILLINNKETLHHRNVKSPVTMNS